MDSRPLGASVEVSCARTHGFPGPLPKATPPLAWRYLAFLHVPFHASVHPFYPRTKHAFLGPHNLMSGPVSREAETPRSRPARSWAASGGKRCCFSSCRTAGRGTAWRSLGFRSLPSYMCGGFSASPL